VRYIDFEGIMSAPRMSRYVTACGGNTRKAMTLYRKNLQLSQELFTVISCFEIALRNAIDRHCLAVIGPDWLRNGAFPGGIFDNHNTRTTKNNILDVYKDLGTRYTHSKLVAELGFGFWRYMFAPHQFKSTGSTLLRIFPAKPTSTPNIQYNNVYVFNQLKQINDIRNRIAHHEPICFSSPPLAKNCSYVRQHYAYPSAFSMDVDR